MDSETKLVLVNAIYFKGSWHQRFLERNTSDAEFRINKVPLLRILHSTTDTLQSCNLNPAPNITSNGGLTSFNDVNLCVCVSPLKTDKKQVKMMFQNDYFPLAVIPEANCQVRPIVNHQNY